MGIENFNIAPEEKFEKERTPLQLKMDIQKSYIGHYFSPDDHKKMVRWISKHHDDMGSIFDELNNEHVDFGYLWDTNPEAVLDVFHERLKDTLNDLGEDYEVAA